MIRPSNASRSQGALLAVAVAAVTLVAVVAAAALRDDVDRTTDAPPATTEPPVLRAFAVPFSFSLDGASDDWTSVDGRDPLVDFDVGPADRLRQTAITFAIPDAASPAAVVADIAARAPSVLEASEPVIATVGNLPATCMDVEPAEGAPDGAPLFEVRGSVVSYDVVLEEAESGRLCVVDVDGRTVIVLVRAPAAEFTGFLEEAQAVLDTIEFE